MNLRLTKLGFTALALVAGQTLVAQDATTGAVTGTIKTNKGQPLAGVRISLDGGRGQVTVVTDAEGKFFASGFIPGKYTISANAAGYEPLKRQTITIALGQKTPLNITLVPSTGAMVEVVAATPNQIDASTVTSGAQFSNEVFAALPLGRSFTSVAAMAPGVVSSGIDSANPSIGGGSGLENQYVIDGANTTNAGYGSSGSFSGLYGSLGTGINTDFIQEVQVKSFALDAEYGQTTGGVINAITKSGTNTFEGAVFAYFDFAPLQAKNKNLVYQFTDQPLFDSYERQELGFFVSGPIIKDKLFYFVGYNPINENTKRIAPHNSTPNQDDYPLAGQKIDQKKTNNSYYIKLQYQLNPSHLFELSTFGDPGERKTGPQLAGDYRGSANKFTNLKFGTDTVTLKYNATIGTNNFLEARISQVKNKLDTTLTAAGFGQWQVRDSAQANKDIQLDGPGLYETNIRGKNTQYDFKFSHSFTNLDVKVGYLHEDITYDGITAGRSGPVGFVDPHNGGVFTTGLRIQKRYYVPDALYNPDWESSDPEVAAAAIAANKAAKQPYYRIERGLTSDPVHYTKTSYDAYFIQGNLHVGNVNVKAGLRAEQQKLSGNALTYTFKAKDNLSPRLGITWDVEGNGKSKVYAFFGRYFEKIPLDIAVRALSTEKGVNRSDFYTIGANFDSLSNPIAQGTSIYDINAVTGVVTPTTKHFATTGTDPTVILPNTKSMYQDEYVVGYDMETSFGMTFSTRLIHRNIGRIMEDLSLDGDSYFIGNPGENEGEIRKITGFEGAATFPKPQRKYSALEVEARKATSRYSFYANLKFSSLEGNYEGLFRGDNGQQDPNISSLYDLPVEAMTDPGRGLTGLEQFLVGALPSDRTVVANVGYTYQWENGFSAGLLSRFQTGTPRTALVAHPAYLNAGEIPRWGRGANGRTPTTFQLDTTFGYTMKLSGKQTLTFRADVFNFFNQQKPVSYNENMDVGYGTTNVNYGVVTGYEPARRVRLGVKFAF